MVEGSNPDSVSKSIAATEVIHPSAREGVENINETVNQPHLLEKVRGEEGRVAVEETVTLREFGYSVASSGDDGEKFLSL